MLKYRAAIILTVAACIFPDPAFPQGYGGPSMLSRGGNRPGQRGRSPVDIAVYGGVRGIVESGLTPVRLEDDGTFASDTVYAAQVELGAYGTHSWKKTTLGLDYRGDYRKSFSDTYRIYDGTNQALSLDLQYQATRRTQLGFRQTAYTSNRAFGGFAAPVVTDLQAFGPANNEVFDTRAYYAQSSLTVSHQMSARTNWFAAGDGFFVKRTNRALVGQQGYRGMGGLIYRLNRRDSLGFIYTYMHFGFARVFGGSNVQGLALQAQRRVSRNLQLALTAGAYRIDAFGTQRVQLSPEVAALLGRSTGVEAFNRRSYIPQIQATAQYSLERSAFTCGIASGVTPGNGVYLTSRQDAVAAGYSFSGIRRVSLGLSTGYLRYDSVSLNLGKLTSYRAGGGMNYRLGGNFDLSSQFDYRTFSSPGLRGREGYFFSFGLTVSATRLPLSIW